MKFFEKSIDERQTVALESIAASLEAIVAGASEEITIGNVTLNGPVEMSDEDARAALRMRMKTRREEWRSKSA